ncbi:MAG: DUF4097 domain-containing protein, partial [Actinomycetota bacterium]|nr:DUF4097 domain-containing protein [Actinomycetota bacterium]
MTPHRGDRLDLDLAGVDRLEIHVIGGEVNVTANRAEAGDVVHVEAEVLRGPAIDVDLRPDGTLVIDHKPVASISGLLAGHVAIRAVVTVTVPERTEVHVRTVSADSFVGGLTDATSVTTVSGRVTATALDGETALKSVSGDVDVQGVAGSVRCVTVSGDLTINGGSPTDVSARSVSGDLTFDLDEIAPLDCTTVSG